jgi:Na+-driven multidrug efflux pump
MNHPENADRLSYNLIDLAIDVISQPFLASTLVDTSAIQAGGNSKYPMIVTTIGIWGIRTVAFTYLLGILD